MLSKISTDVWFILVMFTLIIPSIYGDSAMAASASKLPTPVPKKNPNPSSSTLTIGTILGRANNQWVEGLLPLFITHSHISLLQASFYRQPHHQTMSIGFGQRFWGQATGYWGYNLFYDQTSLQHHQWGLGGELGWRALKLFANGYWPLSSWKSSEQYIGYEERPLQKVDLGVQGYLPKAPWLGASVHYQRYFADQSLPNSQQPRHRPSACWGIGLSYTPVPLLTIDYRYQTGLKSTRHRFGLSLIFRLQTPLAQQIDFNSIAQIKASRDYQSNRIMRQQEILISYRHSPRPVSKASITLKLNTPPGSGPLGRPANPNSISAAPTTGPKISGKKHVRLWDQSVLEDKSTQATNNEDDTFSDEEIDYLPFNTESELIEQQAMEKIDTSLQDAKEIADSLEQLQTDLQRINSLSQQNERNIAEGNRLLEQLQTSLQTLESELAQEYLEKLNQQLPLEALQELQTQLQQATLEKDNFDDSGFFDEDPVIPLPSP